MLMRLSIHKSGEVVAWAPVAFYFGTFEREDEAGAAVAAFRAEYMPFSEEARAAA